MTEIRRKKGKFDAREVWTHRMLSGPARHVNECRTTENMKRGIEVDRNITALTRTLMRVDVCH